MNTLITISAQYLQRVKILVTNILVLYLRASSHKHLETDRSLEKSLQDHAELPNVHGRLFKRSMINVLELTCSARHNLKRYSSTVWAQRPREDEASVRFGPCNEGRPVGF